MFFVSEHAAARYIERFEGNITLDVARERIRRIIRGARFKRVAPGNARIYQTHGIEFVVADNRIRTVYRSDTRPDAEAIQA